jgi:hypothetical protein
MTCDSKINLHTHARGLTRFDIYAAPSPTCLTGIHQTINRAQHRCNSVKGQDYIFQTMRDHFKSSWIYNYLCNQCLLQIKLGV